MIKNVYYLIVGILCVVFSITHALNGQSNLLPVVESAAFELNTKTTIFYLWHIITAENLVFGLAFLVMSVRNDQLKVKFAAWIIAVVMVIRWVVIFFSTLLKNDEGIAGTLTDSIAIIILVGLIFMGTRFSGSKTRSEAVS